MLMRELRERETSSGGMILILAHRDPLVATTKQTRRAPSLSDQPDRTADDADEPTDSAERTGQLAQVGAFDHRLFAGDDVVSTIGAPRQDLTLFE